MSDNCSDYRAWIRYVGSYWKNAPVWKLVMERGKIIELRHGIEEPLDLPVASRGKVNENGRLSLPAAVRRLVGLESGGTVLISVEDGEIRIRTPAVAVRQVRQMLREAGVKPTTSDEFLRQRRKDSGE